MANLIAFIPRATHDAKSNLLDFIDLCRTQSRLLGHDTLFDNDVWETTGIGGKSQRYNSYLCFTRLGIKVRKRIDKLPVIYAETLLSEQFRPFAKALVHYMHSMQPTTNIRVRYEAIRHLEAALLKLNGSTCPTETTPQVLHQACISMVNGSSPLNAYDTAKQLEIIYKFMIKLEILALPATWISPVRPAQIRRNRVGKDFEEERSRKLPSPAALEALAEIFNSCTSNPRQIVFSTICALMLCAPDRITETLYLPLDCFTPDWEDSENKEKGTGLRWFPLKGAAPMVKTIIPSMADIARRAVSNLQRISEPARIVARWYEHNPDKLFLPGNLEYLRDRDDLSMKELDLVLFNGYPSRGRARNWARSNNLPMFRRDNDRSFYTTFKSVEKSLLAMLPKGFPVMDPLTGLKFSESLCIARPGEFDSRGCALQCSVMAINYAAVRTALKGAKSQKSIFDELGYFEADGSSMFISTHMLRHYLNTLFRQGGKLSEEDIAKWSGRKDARQNTAYNHVSDKDMLAHIRKAVGNPNLGVGPLTNIDNRIFITRDKFAELKILTAHTNGLGYCTHDFTMLPCQIHGDCINCAEQVCVKGDMAAAANLRKMQNETYFLLEKAKVAINEGEYGANEWVKHQTLTLERLDQLITILDDPKVPAGSVIQLSGIVPASRLAQATQRRLTNDDSKSISHTIHPVSDEHAMLINEAI